MIVLDSVGSVAASNAGDGAAGIQLWSQARVLGIFAAARWTRRCIAA